MDKILESRLAELERVGEGERADYLRSVIAEAHGEDAVPPKPKPRKRQRGAAKAETADAAGETPEG